MLQANRKIGSRHRGIDNFDCAAEVRPAGRAIGVDVEFYLARRSQVGIEELREMQIHVAQQQHRHGRVASRRNGALKLQIGIGALMDERCTLMTPSL